MLTPSQTGAGGGLTTQGFAGIYDSGCAGSSMWLNSGQNQTGDRICFFKDPNTAGATNLATFFYLHAGRVSDATNSWWAGQDPGQFTGTTGRGPVFTAFQQCNACGVVNWPFMSFN